MTYIDLILCARPVYMARRMLRIIILPQMSFPHERGLIRSFGRGPNFLFIPWMIQTQGNWLESVRYRVYSTIYYWIAVFCISQKMAFINLANARGSTRRARVNEKTVKFYHYGKNQVILISFLYEYRFYIYSYERNVLGRALWIFYLFIPMRDYLSLREKIWEDSARCHR